MGRSHPILTDPVALLAALWAALSLRVVRRRLRTEGLQARTPPAPRLPARGRPGVLAALNRLGATCLERSLIHQRWLAAHGEPSDILIGIDPAGGQDEFHAWVEGYEQHPAHLVIHRIAPPTSRR